MYDIRYALFRFLCDLNFFRVLNLLSSKVCGRIAIETWNMLKFFIERVFYKINFYKRAGAFFDIQSV